MRSAALVLAFCLVPLVRADEKPSHNTLTKEEIAEGWILLFDGETTFGWKTTDDVKVEDGRLRLGGEKESSISTTTAFGPCEVKTEYYLVDKATVTAGGSTHEIMQETLLFWGTMKITIQEQGLTGIAWRNVAIGIGLARNPAMPPKPAAPIRFDVPAGSKLSLRSVKLKPTNMEPLFNGKDLDGWKVFDDPKRKQSKWSVTKEGWLNVANGPGDLQTTKKFDDFVLQFDCLSNGPALNSGLFFRCVANEYQNGYEMQIQNGFKDNDRTKPADFGTGAIYRRVPARKVVSNDKEWFTMTLIANGPHIATWVNGYQTVDWTDDRPADDNPRKGMKTAAGHLSIQGHDPTTDLSFRNMKVGALPPPAAP
jgi:hypothetical protein